MNKKRKLKFIFRIIRLVFYICLFSIFALIPTEVISKRTICLYKHATGNNCPTCGVTRAFSSIMHLKFIDAYNFNQVFTLIIFPIALIIIIEDVVNIIISFVIRKENCSLLEHLFTL